MPLDTIDPTDTFLLWKDKTNDAIDFLNNLVIPNLDDFVDKTSYEAIGGFKNFTDGIQLNGIGFTGAGSVITADGTLAATVLSNTGDTMILRGNTYTLPATSISGFLLNTTGIQSWYPLSSLIDEIQVLLSNDVTLAKGIIPVGTIVPWIGVDAPGGWLICDGSLVSQALYPDMDGILPESGSDYVLPDLDGKVIVGVTNPANLGVLIGNTDLAAGSDHYQAHYIIKVEADAVALFSISEGDGVTIVGNIPGGGTTNTIGFAGGSIGINANPTDFEFDTGMLKLVGGTTADATPSSIMRRAADSSVKGFTPISPDGDNYATVDYIASLNLGAVVPPGSIISLPSADSNSFSPSGAGCYAYLTERGTVKVWGRGNGISDGRFGSQDNAGGVEISLPWPRVAKKIYVCISNLFIIDDLDKLWSMGYNADGWRSCMRVTSVGNAEQPGQSQKYNAPTKAVNDETVSKVIVANENSASAVGAISVAGELWIAGRNDNGIIGDGTISSAHNKVFKTLTATGSPSGTQIGKVLDAKILGSTADGTRSWAMALVQRTEGNPATNEVWTVGYGNDGNMGQGYTTRDNPVWSPVKNFVSPTTLSAVTYAYTASPLSKIFTLSAHGLNTLDQVKFNTSLSSLNTTTAYFVRRLSANTFSIHSSPALANSGTTPLGPTSNATGISADAYKPITDVRSIHGGGYDAQTFAFLVKNNGEAWGWGANSNGNLGNGNTSNVSKPEILAIPGGAAVADIKCAGNGFRATWVVTTTGACYFAGREPGTGVSGLGGSARNVTTWTLVNFGAANRRVNKLFVSNSSTSSPAFALIRVGGETPDPETDTWDLYGWGKNNTGELGLGDINTRSTPTKIQSLPFDAKLISDLWISSPVSVSSSSDAVHILVKQSGASTGYVHVSGYQLYGHANTSTSNATSLVFFTQYKV